MLHRGALSERGVSRMVAADGEAVASARETTTPRRKPGVSRRSGGYAVMPACAATGRSSTLTTSVIGSFARSSARRLGRVGFTPHGLRHTFASLHLARGTPIKWIQSRGGWASAKLVLDLYGHFLPSDYSGFADALGEVTPGSPKPPGRTPGAPCSRGAPCNTGTRTEKPQNTALAGSPGRTRTCDPLVNRGRGARGITRTYTTARFTVRIQAHRLFPETAPRPPGGPIRALANAARRPSLPRWRSTAMATTRYLAGRTARQRLHDGSQIRARCVIASTKREPPDAMATHLDYRKKADAAARR